MLQTAVFISIANIQVNFWVFFFLLFSGFILKRNSADETTPNFHLQAHCSTKNDFQSFYLFFDDGKTKSDIQLVSSSNSFIFHFFEALWFDLKR